MIRYFNLLIPALLIHYSLDFVVFNGFYFSLGSKSGLIDAIGVIKALAQLPGERAAIAVALVSAPKLT